MTCGPRQPILAALVATVCAWVYAGSAHGQFAVMSFRATGASGVECVNGADDHPSACDWYLTPHDVLVLHRVPQLISWELYISDFGNVGIGRKTRVRAYQAAIRCSSLFNGHARLTPLDTRCDEFPISDDEFCAGVDETREDFIYAAAPVLQACNLEALCPDGLPGVYFCGALPLATDDAAIDPGPGEAFYAATFAALVPVEARGLYRIAMDPAAVLTFLLNVDAEPIAPLALRSANVRISEGRCCGVPSGEHGCLDYVTYEECVAAGGSGFLPDETCSGFDGDRNGADDACAPCESDDDCPDAPPCGIGVCDDVTAQCRFVVTNENVCLVDGQCLPDNSESETEVCTVCDPEIDPRDLVPLRDGRLCAADGNECTDDECLYGVCEHLPVTGRLCGNPANSTCNGADQCVAGDCDAMIRPAGTLCGDPTNSTCNPADTCDGSGLCQIRVEPNGVPCYDGRFCTVGDSCQNGICFPGNEPGPCTNDFYCDELNDRCVDCVSDLDCADGNECTEDVCADGACSNAQLEFGAACGDQSVSLCDGGDICDGNGHCIPNHTPDGTDCDDGFFCNGVSTCNGGRCQMAGIPCTLPQRVCDEGDDDCICMFAGGDEPAPGDFDVDGTVNLADYAAFPDCLFRGAYVPSSCCHIFDFNADGLVDLRDAAGFQVDFAPGEPDGD